MAAPGVSAGRWLNSHSCIGIKRHRKRASRRDRRFAGGEVVGCKGIINAKTVLFNKIHASEKTFPVIDVSANKYLLTIPQREVIHGAIQPFFGGSLPVEIGFDTVRGEVFRRSCPFDHPSLNGFLRRDDQLPLPCDQYLTNVVSLTANGLPSESRT